MLFDGRPTSFVVNLVSGPAIPSIRGPRSCDATGESYATRGSDRLCEKRLLTQAAERGFYDRAITNYAIETEELMMGRLNNKVAIVTGGASGIGEAITRLFIAEGAKVLVTDVNDDNGEKLARELGDSARYIHLDVGVRTQWDEAVEKAEQEFGSLNVVINNAGIHTQHDILSSPEEDFDRIVNVNQRGVFNGIRASVPALLRSGGGSIVNASSIGGLLGLGGAATIYRSTKWAVRGLSRTAAHDLAGTGIRVNTVLPGATRTAMFANGNHADHEDQILQMIPLRRIGAPVELAQAFLFLASDDSSYMTGGEIVVDGGWSA